MGDSDLHTLFLIGSILAILWTVGSLLVIALLYFVGREPERDVELLYCPECGGITVHSADCSRSPVSRLRKG